MKLKTFKDCVEKAGNYSPSKESKEFDCDVEITEEGRTFKAYSVSICRDDLLFYCGEACISYTVDHYGDDLRAELRDIEE